MGFNSGFKGLKIQGGDHKNMAVGVINGPDDRLHMAVGVINRPDDRLHLCQVKRLSAFSMITTILSDTQQ